MAKFHKLTPLDELFNQVMPEHQAIGISWAPEEYINPIDSVHNRTKKKKKKKKKPKRTTSY